MRSTQTKFEELIAAEAKNAALEVVNDRSFTNVGVLRIQTPDSFTTLVRIAYDWQSSGNGSVSMKIRPKLTGVGKPDEGDPENATVIWMDGDFRDLPKVIAESIAVALYRVAEGA